MESIILRARTSTCTAAPIHRGCESRICSVIPPVIPPGHHSLADSSDVSEYGVACASILDGLNLKGGSVERSCKAINAASKCAHKAHNLHVRSYRDTCMSVNAATKLSWAAHLPVHGRVGVGGVRAGWDDHWLTRGGVHVARSERNSNPIGARKRGTHPRDHLQRLNSSHRVECSCSGQALHCSWERRGLQCRRCVV